MPYVVCPHCRLRVYSAAGHSTRDPCPSCGHGLPPTWARAGSHRPRREPEPVPRAAAGGTAIERLLAVTREQLDMDAAVLSEVRDGQEVVVRADERAAAKLLPGFGLPLEDTICEQLLQGRIGEVVADVRAEPALRGLRSVRELGIGAYVGVPLTAHDARAYVLCCLTREVRPELGPLDALFLQGIGQAVLAELRRSEAAGEVR